MSDLVYIEDGNSKKWSRLCLECETETMEIMEEGKLRCSSCQTDAGRIPHIEIINPPTMWTP